MKDKIKFEEFLEIEKRLEIKVGYIISVDPVEKSKKLLVMQVAFGDGDTRQVVTNILPHFSREEDAMDQTAPLLHAREQLVHSHRMFVTNLEPSKIMGLDSGAMILPGPVEEGKLLGIEGVNIRGTFSLDGTKIL